MPSSNGALSGEPDRQDFRDFHSRDYVRRERPQERLLTLLPVDGKHSATAWIVGESGTGKTWLANWYMKEAAGAKVRVVRFPSPLGAGSDEGYLRGALLQFQPITAAGAVQMLEPLILSAFGALLGQVLSPGESTLSAHVAVDLVMKKLESALTKDLTQVGIDIGVAGEKLVRGNTLVVIDDVQALGPLSSSFVAKFMKVVADSGGSVRLLMVGEVTQARAELGRIGRQAADRAKRELAQDVIDRYDLPGEASDSVLVSRLEPQEVAGLLRVIARSIDKPLWAQVFRKPQHSDAHEIRDSDVFEAVNQLGQAEALYTAQALRWALDQNPPLFVVGDSTLSAIDGWADRLPNGVTSALRRRLEDNPEWLLALRVLVSMPLSGTPREWLEDADLREWNAELHSAMQSLLAEPTSTSWLREVDVVSSLGRERIGIGHQRFARALDEAQTAVEKQAGNTLAIRLAARGLAGGDASVTATEALSLAAWGTTATGEISDAPLEDQLSLVTGYLELGGQVAAEGTEHDILERGDALFRELESDPSAKAEQLVRYALARDQYEWFDADNRWLELAKEHSASVRQGDLLLALDLRTWRNAPGTLEAQARALVRVLRRAPRTSSTEQALDQVAKSSTDAHRVARALWEVGETDLSIEVIEATIEFLRDYELPLCESRLGPLAPVVDGEPCTVDARQLRLIRLYFDYAYAKLVLALSADTPELRDACMSASAAMIRRLRKLPLPTRAEPDAPIDLVAWRLFEAGVLERDYLVVDGRPAKPLATTKKAAFNCLGRSCRRWEASLMSVEDAKLIHRGSAEPLPRTALDDEDLKLEARSWWDWVQETQQDLLQDLKNESMTKVKPEGASTTDFFEFFSYMIFRAGLKGAYTEKLRDRLSAALFDSDPVQVVSKPEDASAAFLAIVNAPQKRKGIVQVAEALAVYPHVGRQLLSFMDGGQFMHWAKGFFKVQDVIASVTGTEFGFEDLTGSMKAADDFAKYLGYSGMREMIRYVQLVTGQEPKLVDTVLHYTNR